MPSILAQKPTDSPLDQFDTAHRLSRPKSSREERILAAADHAFRRSGYPALWDLQCEVEGGVVILHGVVPTYYLKQVAQEAVRALDEVQTVENLVEVRSPPNRSTSQSHGNQPDMLPIRKSLALSVVLLAVLWGYTRAEPPREALSPVITKPRPVSMAELGQMKTSGVSVVEVSDYVFGNYQGDFPSPPHADLNPKKAYIIFWRDFPFRFVFSHEASYCPWFELPSGAAVNFQFFEGNNGSDDKAELFNQWGRQEKNSFVDIIESGPQRVWVRWTYFGVHVRTGERFYRATEDFWAYPNGLIVRRQTHQSLLPGQHKAYAPEPIELMGMCPVGKLWFDVLAQDSSSGESHALAVLDAFSDKRYDVFWTPKPGTLWGSTARRTGCDWKELEDSPGVIMVVPLADGAPFCVFGDASGFHHQYTKLKDHTFEAEGGEHWESITWDHWPIGWLNDQWREADENSLNHYPNHFSPLSMDFFALPDEEVERGVYYSLIGVAGPDLEPLRPLARSWLTKGTARIAQPDSGADLPAAFPVPEAQH